jgi:hypothetical protein
MRCVREFFSFQIGYWMEIANGGTEGQRAYAFRQAAIRETMLQQCNDVWKDIPRFMALGIGAEEEGQAQ